MTAEVLSTETPALFDQAVARAAALLRDGQVVALPTETVYGLAANAWNAAAVRRIFQVKERPAENPIIVHVASLEMARRCVAAWPAPARRLAAAFWPGPLTLVLPRAQAIPPPVTAGGATVGVRWPSHPFMQAVIRACGFPLAAPSANRSTELSPTTAEHVRKSLGGRIPLIVDGGPARVGLESSVLDLASLPPRLLRPGMISAASLRAVLGQDGLATAAGADAVLRSPGLLPRHYSPRAKLAVLHWRDEADLASRISRLGVAPEKTHILTHSGAPLRQQFGRVALIPPNAAAWARALYAELHRCDEAGAELIVVEAPPAGEAWRAIADRLERAAHVAPRH